MRGPEFHKQVKISKHSRGGAADLRKNPINSPCFRGLGLRIFWTKGPNFLLLKELRAYLGLDHPDLSATRNIIGRDIPHPKGLDHPDLSATRNQ